MDETQRPTTEPVEPVVADVEPVASHEVEERVARTLDRTVGAAVERAAAHVPDTVKPKLRGWLHLGAAPVAAVGGIFLVLLARGSSELAAVAVYAIATTLLFTVSATYHRGRWSPRATPPRRCPKPPPCSTRSARWRSASRVLRGGGRSPARPRPIAPRRNPGSNSP